MNKPYSRHHNRELGTVWFVVPLLAICATLLVLMLFSRPASLAQTQRAQPAAPVEEPYVDSDPSLPAASSVFKDGASYEAAEHVDTF